MALIKLSELFNHADVMTTRRYLGLRTEELLETYDMLSFDIKKYICKNITAHIEL